MKISKEYREKIKKIMTEFKCPKNFKCYRLGFDKMCKAKDRGLAMYILCLEKDPKDCVFAVRFGSGFFCRCPMRVYMVKELNK